VAQSEEKEGGL
jgi:hypothetical protein